MKIDAFFDELEKIAALPGSMLLGTGLGMATGAGAGALSNPKDRAMGALRGGALGGLMGAGAGAGAHLVRSKVLAPKALGMMDDVFAANPQTMEEGAALVGRIGNKAKWINRADKAMHYGVPLAAGAAAGAAPVGGYLGGK